MHHTKYLSLEVYILPTSNFNRIDHFKHKIALKHTFQSNNFSQPNHDNEFTFYFIKVALSLVFGLKQFTKTQTKLFPFFLLSQFSISCFLFKILNQNELQKSLERYSKGDFFTIKSLKTTCHTSTLIDHITTNCEEKVTQSGVINTSLSDHQLTFCTKNIKRVKTNNHKQIYFCSLTNYSMESFERELKNIVFPDYEKFSDINSIYSDLVNKITQVINNLASYKTIRVKNQSNKWFDGELAEQISDRDKLFKKFEKSKLHIDKLIYKEAKNTVQHLINGNKKKNFAKN